MTLDNTTLGQRIQVARKVRDLNQKKLAMLAGLHLMSISNFERDIRHPSPKSLRKLAIALKVSELWLEKAIGIGPSEPNSESFSSPINNQNQGQVLDLKTEDNQFPRPSRTIDGDRAFKAVKLFNDYLLTRKSMMPNTKELTEIDKVKGNIIEDIYDYLATCDTFEIWQTSDLVNEHLNKNKHKSK